VRKRHVIPAGGALACAVLMFAGPAAATPAEGDAERTDLGRGTTDTPISVETNGPTTLYVQKVVLKPGANTGWHAHAGTEYTVVNRGTVYLQTASNCTPAIFGPGQAIFMPAGVPHIAGTQGSEDAEVVVTYTLPVSAAVRDDEPAACPAQ
jgi:quercetin dioxygenase-like cupin family protein